MDKCIRSITNQTNYLHTNNLFDIADIMCCIAMNKVI